jgi:hypothetical protein
VGLPALDVGCYARQAARSFGSLARVQAVMVIVNWARIAAIALRDMSVVSSLSRFFVKTVGLQPGASPVQG